MNTNISNSNVESLKANYNKNNSSRRISGSSFRAQVNNKRRYTSV